MPAIDNTKRTTPETIETLLASAVGAGPVRAQKMFGEYALYCNEKVVGLVCRDELFLKNIGQPLELVTGLELLPAYPSAKPGFHVPKDRWSDAEWLAKIIRATADAVPAKKK